MYFILVFFYKSTRYSLFMPLQYRYPIYFSAAASGWAGWALAHPEFGSSVNPITTRGADYVHHITASPPGFENPAASLQGVPDQISIPLNKLPWSERRQLQLSLTSSQLNSIL